ncbi:hypothetical protein FB451DRAFT_1509666 [Mycena latifolia]|nr:hypothetical protein FB451DRAFT_1509666 [Mycena latifolia]
MPHPPATVQTRLDNIVASLGAAVTTFDVVSKSLKTPFLQPISNTLHSLLTIMQVKFRNSSFLLVFTETCQTVKRNQDECTQMLEQIHELLYAVIWVHVKSDTGGELSPMITLHKVHTFVEAEQEKSKIKQFFRQGEMRTLLKACHRGLDQALDVFKVQGAKILSDVADMQQHAQKTHQEVLELISALSEGNSECGSSISRVLSSSHNSSNSFSLLPSEPKIFHGRELEVSTIIQQLNQPIPRIAILGGGGMGKTTLARAILCHPEISAKYQQHRFFVACDAASSCVHLAALIGAHVGLKPGQDLTKPVIRYFSGSPPSLLILDNLETIWEPREWHADVEKFLALLEDIEHLVLIITMRGAERPANVRWTHPFLKPLKPLAQEAARKTFIDIVDDGYAVEDMDKILLLADNMPLAIDLIAHLVDYDGLESVMHHWETEKTSLLSEGHNKGSNLDLSISMSLESPRLASVPHACDLLSLLSMLPDGLSDIELLQTQFPIENILACKAALLRTSLAYIDDQKRLKALVPIREYMQKMHPPIAHMIQPLMKHFIHLLEIHSTYHGTVSSPAIVARIALNLANIQNVLIDGLKQDNPDLVSTIECACQFERFIRQTGHGPGQLIHQIQKVLPQPRDYRLEVYFILALLGQKVGNEEDVVNQAIKCLPHLDDPDLKSGNTNRQSDLLATLASLKWQTGAYSTAQEHASESQRLAKISGNLFCEAWALHVECGCWYALGNYNHSMLLANRARNLLSLCAMSGGELDLATLNDQAEIHLLKSEYVEARGIRTQILWTAPIEQNQYHHALTLLNISQIDIELGTLSDGVYRNIDTAKQLFSCMQYSMGFIWCDMIMAALNVNQGDLLKARSLFQICLESAWGKETEAISYCLEKLGNASLWLAVDHASYHWTVTFLVHSLKLKQKLEIHKALQFLGDVYLANGDQETAVSLFTVALEGFTKMDVHCSRAECILRLGDISELHGDLSKAAELWKTARPLFERSSQAKQIGHIDERLARMSNLLEHHSDPFIQLSALNALTTLERMHVERKDDIQLTLIPT